jgi:hypothetical protein
MDAKEVRMPRVIERPPIEGSRQKANGRKHRQRVADTWPATPELNEPDERLPPGSAGHESRSSPKRSAQQCQLESHGTVLSDDDSPWAQD